MCHLRYTFISLITNSIEFYILVPLGVSITNKKTKSAYREYKNDISMIKGAFVSLFWILLYLVKMLKSTKFLREKQSNDMHKKAVK